MAEVNLRNVVKHYEGTPAVRGINLDIANEEFVVLVGPSGCGKSTTLRMIAGLEEANEGDILIGGTVVNDLRPKARDIAMVFQNYALYPHMTVFENMAFSLRQRRHSREDISKRVDEAARILNIGDLLERKPRQLSGGQRQRVAMGRAIVRNPKVFLFDEPLSNLDAQLRVQMRTEIKKLRRKLRTTTVYVTHDQIEALTLADRVVVMNNGNIEQAATPHELYHEPKTRFVAAFIGSPTMNFLPVRLENRQGRLTAILPGKVELVLPEERSRRYCKLAEREGLEIGIRPEHITEARGELLPGQAPFETKVEVTEPIGAETLVYFNIGDAQVCGMTRYQTGAREQQTIRMCADMNHIHLFDSKTALVI